VKLVATFSPNDKKLAKDIEDLEKAIALKERNAGASATRPENQPILITEPSDQDMLLKPLKTTIFKTRKRETPSPSQSNPCEEESIMTSLATEAVKEVSSAVSGNNPPVVFNSESKQHVNMAQVAPHQPLTALEFERVCTSLKQEVNRLRDYVKSIEIDRYPALFKESLSTGILQTFVEVLRKGFMPDDAEVHYFLKDGFIASEKSIVTWSSFAYAIYLLATKIYVYTYVPYIYI
jgi:hypothetical protein